MEIVKINHHNSTSYLILMLLILAAAGCNNNPQSGPEKVLTKYLQSYYSGDYDSAYKYICSKDSKKKSLQKFKNENAGYSDKELTKLIADNTSFQIKSSDIIDNTATIEVVTTTVDVNIITNEFANAGMNAALSGKSFDDIQRKIAQKYKSQKLPLNSYYSTFNLVKENGEWKVNLNW